MEYTLSLHKEVKNKTFDGQMGVDDFKNYLKLALESETQLKEELSKFSKDELIKYANSYTIRPSDKKDSIISHIYTDIIAFFALGSYSWSYGQGKYDGIISKVNNFTQKNLDDFAVQVAKEREEYKKRLEAHKKALSNPETLQEYQTFIKYNGKSKLSPEQMAIYDELVGVTTKERQAKEIEQKAVISQVNVSDNVDFNIYETKHTKTGQPLYVVKLSERVSKETYNDLNSKAKKLGGWYSSYTKDGAIAGFQFKDKEYAEKFVSLKQGNVSNIEKIEEKQEQKAEKRASKLRENAEAIIERVDKELSKDRQTNTARRASMANSIESRLNGEKSIAKTMINLANAIESGETKFLDLVRTKAQIEQLNNIVQNANYNFLRKKYTNYSEYEAHKYDPITVECIDYVQPFMLFFPLIHTGNWQRVVNDNQSKSGLKLISNKIQKYLSRAKDEQYQIKDKYEMADFLEFASKLTDNWDNKRIIEFAKDHNRLKSLGIESNEMLRALLRKFIQYRGGVQEVDKVKTLERGLAGKKVGIDFFPTPATVCAEMVEMAEITDGMDVLEPSAGNGNIADAIKSITGVVCDVCEVSSELRAILEAKGYNVVDFDFLSYNEKKYDRIIMNPPFSNRMDGEHIQHAYSLLKPNGRIVAIAGEGIFIGSDKKATVFREWIDATNSDVQKLPEKTFTDKSLYANTGANARLIVINKGEEDKEELKETELIEDIKETEIINDNHTSDKKQEYKEIIETLKNDENFVKSIKDAFQNIVSDENIKLKSLLEKEESLKAEEKQIWDIVSEMTYSKEKDELNDKRTKIKLQLKILTQDVLIQKNIVKALENGGITVEIEDTEGFKHENIADFTNINAQNIAFDEDTILSEPTPNYIPFVDEEKFRDKGYIFDAIRVSDDKYLLCVSQFNYKLSQDNFVREELNIPEDSIENKKQRMVLLTLEQLVLTIDYYLTKAKANEVKKAEQSSKRQEDYYDKLPETRRESHLMQRGFYNGLPVKIQKTISKEDYEKLNWQEREKIYKPYKRYAPKRLKSKLEEDSMWASFHEMYRIFLDKDAWIIDKNRIPQVGKVSGFQFYSNPKTSTYWHWIKDMLDYKLKDIKVQREEFSDNYKAAIETSFGESNTSDVLKNEFGLLVKRQNGDTIKPIEIEQIKDAWISIREALGELKESFLNNSIKISHSGNRLIFASKAIGVFVPEMGTIGISAKYGETQFMLTFAHELGHFIDFVVGNKDNKRYATDNFESTAGKIAFAFRDNMNKPKQKQTDYINATTECFARAIEQYYGYKVLGENAMLKHSYFELDREYPIATADHFVNNSKFEQIILPLIEQFFEENKDLLRYSTNTINNTDMPIMTREPQNVEVEEIKTENLPIDADVEKQQYKFIFSDNETILSDISDIEDFPKYTFNLDIGEFTFESEEDRNKAIELVDSYQSKRNKDKDYSKTVLELKNRFETYKLDKTNKANMQILSMVFSSFVHEFLTKGYFNDINLFFEINAELPKKFKEFVDLNDVEYSDFGSNLISKGVNIWNHIPESYKQVADIKKVNYSISKDDEKLLSLFRPFVGNDSLRPVIEGISFDEYGIAATNTHKLFFIPSKHEIRGIYCATKKCFNDAGEKEKVDGSFPKYQQIIPANKSTLDLNAYSLLSFLNAFEKSNLINEVVESVILLIEDKFFAFKIENLKPSLEAIIKIGYSDVTLSFSESSKPLCITPKGMYDTYKITNLQIPFALIMPLWNGGNNNKHFYFDCNSESFMQKDSQPISLNPMVIKEEVLQEKTKKLENIVQEVSQKLETIEKKEIELNNKIKEVEENAVNLLDFDDVSKKIIAKKLQKIQDFMNPAQLSIVKGSNEYDDVINSLYKVIAQTPEIYGTESVSLHEKIAYLHYFKGGNDWYIVELPNIDIKDDNLSMEGTAFGYAMLNGVSEFGYIDINELKQTGVELDFHFNPTPMYKLFPNEFEAPTQEIETIVETEQPKETTVDDLKMRIKTIERMIKKGAGDKSQLEMRIKTINRMISKKEKFANGGKIDNGFSEHQIREIKNFMENDSKLEFQYNSERQLVYSGVNNGIDSDYELQRIAKLIKSKFHYAIPRFEIKNKIDYFYIDYKYKFEQGGSTESYEINSFGGFNVGENVELNGKQYKIISFSDLHKFNKKTLLPETKVKLKNINGGAVRTVFIYQLKFDESKIVK